MEGFVICNDQFPVSFMDLPSIMELTFAIFLLVIAINCPLEALKFVLSKNLGAISSLLFLLLLLKFNYRHEFIVI